MTIPIHFLLGFSRSGTSILMSLLRGHPDIETGFEEPNALFRLMSAVKWSDEHEEELGVSSEYITKLHDDAIKVYTDYFYSGFCKETGRSAVVLKHPWLSIYIRRLGMIFPEAKFVVLVRHPYDTLASTIDFRDTDRQAEQMFPEDLNKLIDLYWKHVKTSLNAVSVLKDRISYEKYEDLLATPGQVLGRMFKFYDLRHGNGIISSVLEKANSGELPLTARVLMTSKLIEPQDKWSKLKEEDQARIRNRLGPLLQKLGYEEK